MSDPSDEEIRAARERQQELEAEQARVQRIAQRGLRKVAGIEQNASDIITKRITAAISELAVRARELVLKGKMGPQLKRAIDAEMRRLTSALAREIVARDLLTHARDAARIAREQVAQIRGETPSGLPDGSIGFSFEAIDQRSVRLALENSHQHIKGVLDDAALEVRKIVSRSIRKELSPSKIAEEIRSRVRIDGTENLTEARAETIARNETFSVYRQVTMSRYQELGIKDFIMTGPVDGRISEICSQYVGQTKTAAQWKKIEPLVFVYGLHHNCRHSWDANE